MTAQTESSTPMVEIADLDLGEVRKLKGTALARGLDRVLNDIDSPQLGTTGFGSAI